MSRVPPRSLRNNNPGNLRTGIPWKGLCPREKMTPEQAAETEFCVFETAKMGFRALAVNMRTSWQQGRRTVRALISHFAPPNENDTETYIGAVCAMTHKGPDEELNLRDQDVLYALVRAVAVHEAGGWMFDTHDLIDGCLMSGVGDKEIA
jgi:hypothetical protein